MNKFAGNITFKWNPDIKSIKDKHIENISEEGDKTLFIFWKTEISSSEELENSFSGIWEILYSDISISTEDNISILSDSIDKEWLYESVSFEWPWVNFNDIQSRFLDNFEVISVREIEESEKFWNRIVKVDFIY